MVSWRMSVRERLRSAIRRLDGDDALSPEDRATFARERWKSEDGRYLERFRRIQLQF